MKFRSLFSGEKQDTCHHFCRLVTFPKVLKVFELPQGFVVPYKMSTVLSTSLERTFLLGVLFLNEKYSVLTDHIYTEIICVFVSVFCFHIFTLKLK